MSDQTSLPNRTFTVASDDSLSELILKARKRIVFIAPGISDPIAKALVSRLDDAQLSIEVILDNDPEVYRLGYGTPEGLTILKARLDANQIGLRCQPGIRIGVLVVDDNTMIYSPVPQLIEAGSTSAAKPNALFLGGNTSTKISEAAGASENTLPSDSEIGVNALTPKDVEAIQKNVSENPPEPFDLTQKARVFSSRLQYVEFKVENYQLTNQRVSIPAHLMGLAGEHQERWHNGLAVMDMAATEVTLKITGHDGKVQEVRVNQKYLEAARKKIEKTYLIPVTGFGSVMFKNKQKEFEAEIESFQELLDKYFEKLKEQIDKTLKDLVDSVVTRLLPSVIANVPDQYKRHETPNEADIARFLQRDIERAINVKTLIQEPKIKKVYKDIAYQSVKSNDFEKLLNKALTNANVPDSIINEVFHECGAVLAKRGELF